MTYQTTDLDIVVLAAGSSSRLGQAKQLVDLEGDPLLIRQVKLALSICKNITVVIGHNAQTYRELLAPWPVNVVENTNWFLGMGTSIACGVRSIQNASNILFLLVDQWQLVTQDLDKLLNQHFAGEQLATVSCWHDVNCQTVEFGPPVIFSQPLFEQLSQLKGKQGAKFVLTNLISQNKQLVTQIELASAKFDLDTPEQLRKLQFQRKA